MRWRVAVALLSLTPAIAAGQQAITGDQATATYVNGGMSSLLGSVIGAQQLNSTSTTTNNYAVSNTAAAMPSNTKAEITSVPTVYAPGLTAAGSDVCLGSGSASLTILGLGVSGGKTYVDENCVMLKNSQRLASYGFTAAAVVVMFADKRIAEAFRTSSPAIYLQIMQDRAANLKAEIEVAEALGEDASDLKAKYEPIQREVRVMTVRVAMKSGADIPKVTVKDVSTDGGASGAASANDPRLTIKE